MEGLIILGAAVALLLYFRRSLDRERAKSLLGVWRFDRLIQSPSEVEQWNDHVVVFASGGSGRVVPSQALSKFEWSVKGETIRLRVPGVTRSLWKFKIIGDELTTEDLHTKNVVRFRRTTDSSVLKMLEDHQETLNRTGIYWDRQEYAAGYLSQHLLSGMTESEKRNALRSCVREVKEIPPFVQSEISTQMAGSWVCPLTDGTALAIDFGSDGVAVFSVGGHPIQTLEYRLEESPRPSCVDLFEGGFALRYNVRFLSDGQLHLKNDLLNAIFERTPRD